MNEIIIFPSKLVAGDEVRIIAPSRSMAIVSENLREIADQRFTQLGLKVSFGKHTEEIDDFRSSSIMSRVEDLHSAFCDTHVKAIFTVIGGFNANQLLRYIDWELIKHNPKIFCGYSDITVLNNALLAKSGLVSYSGPHYSTFGQEKYFDYTLDYFKKCLFSDDPFEIRPSETWSDDLWFKDQSNRDIVKNDGYLVINNGEATGVIIGGNICTLSLLQGTEYFPALESSVIFIEDDDESTPHDFDRILQSLIHQPTNDRDKGVVIGRFQNASKLTDDLLIKIVKSKKELNKLPIIAHVDFGHTDPKITFPIGGEVSVSATVEKVKIIIKRH